MRSFRYLRAERTLAEFIADLPEARSDALSDLIVHFKKLGGSIENAERVWNANVTQIATSNGYESLTVSETERRLETSLQFQFPKSKQPEKFWKLEDYREFIRLPERATVLNGLSENLMVLGVRANPVCRPIVLEYQQIASTLAHGKTRGVDRRLTRLSNARETLTARVQQIDDYMNWFEGTQSSARSGTFVEYLKSAEKPPLHIGAMRFRFIWIRWKIRCATDPDWSGETIGARLKGQKPQPVQFPCLAEPRERSRCMRRS